MATQRVEFNEPVAIFSLAFSPDGSMLATSSPYSREVHVWAWRGQPKLVQTLYQLSEGQTQGGGGQTDALRYSPDGRTLLSGHGAGNGGFNTIRVWDAHTGKVLDDIADAFGSLSTLGRAGFELSPDGRLLVRIRIGGPRKGSLPAEAPDSVIVDDTANWQKVWGLNTDPFYLGGIAMSASGHYVALSGAERVEGPRHLQYAVLVVDLTKRSVMSSVEIPSSYMDTLTWSPDDRRIVCAGNELVMFDVATGNGLGEYPSPGSPIRLMYTPDGKRLLIAWSTGVEIWDSDHTKIQQRLPGKLVHAAALSSDGRYLAFVDDYRVHVWELR